MTIRRKFANENSQTASILARFQVIDFHAHLAFSSFDDLITSFRSLSITVFNITSLVAFSFVIVH